MTHEVLEIDAIGLNCPMPVIKLQNGLRSVEGNKHVKIICSDPGVCKDIPAWVRVNKHTIVDEQFDSNNNRFEFTVCKKS